MRNSDEEKSPAPSAAGSVCTSHSSRVQNFSVHHPPLLRHGPAAAVTRCATPRRITRSGTPFFICTRAGSGGRKMRMAVRGLLPLRPLQLHPPLPQGVLFWKATMRKAPGACVSSNSADPTRVSPAMLRMRASVSSSRSGSGPRGRNNPACAKRGGAGSAEIAIFFTGASGGCAARSSCSSLSKVRLSSIGTGNRRLRSCER